MNLFTNGKIIGRDGKPTAVSSILLIKLAVLIFALGIVSKPAPARGALLIALIVAPLIIIDHNSCWVNLIWGCHSDNGGGGSGGDGGGGTVTYTYTSSFPPKDDTNGLVTNGSDGGSPRDSIDSKPCTQGETCPGDDLGSVVKDRSIVVSPAYADSKTNTCPLFWLPGGTNSLSTITCKVVTATSTIDASGITKDASGKYRLQIPVGRSTLSCTRKTTEVVTQYGAKDGGAPVKVKEQTNVFETTEDHPVKCLPNPKVQEI